jgi:hypothetical protein
MGASTSRNLGDNTVRSRNNNDENLSRNPENSVETREEFLQAIYSQNDSLNVGSRFDSQVIN